jgi:hypothetical protein
MLFRTEINVKTGDSVRIEQVAYRNAANDRLVLDTGEVPPAGFYEFDHSADPAPLQTPASITRRQARLCLLQAGKLAAVEQAIVDIADTAQRTAAQIEYENDTWERNNPWIDQLGQAVDLSVTDIDQLFITAATL